MDAYEIVKFLHVLSAATWFGAAVSLTILLVRVRAAEDAAAARIVTAHVSALSGRVFAPVSGLTLIFGVLGVFLSEGAWRFTDLWILIGLVGFVIMGIVVGAYGTRLEKRLDDMEARAEPDDAQLGTLRRQTMRLNLFDIGMLAVIIWAMVTKPTL